MQHAINRTSHAYSKRRMLQLQHTLIDDNTDAAKRERPTPATVQSSFTQELKLQQKVETAKHGNFKRQLQHQNATSQQHKQSAANPTARTLPA